MRKDYARRAMMDVFLVEKKAFFKIFDKEKLVIKQEEIIPLKYADKSSIINILSVKLFEIRIAVKNFLKEDDGFVMLNSVLIQYNKSKRNIMLYITIAGCSLSHYRSLDIEDFPDLIRYKFSEVESKIINIFSEKFNIEKNGVYRIVNIKP